MTTDKNTNISGIHGSIVNTGPVSGNIANIVTLAGLNAKSNEKEELVTLFQKLEAEIKKLPDDKKDAAETLLDRLNLIIRGLERQDPDKEVVKFGIESLKKAAENVASVMPTILAIALDIASKIRTVVQL